MDIQERLDLIQRNTQEIVNVEDLKLLLEKRNILLFIAVMNLMGQCI